MAIGPLERDALRKRVREQYNDQSVAVITLGLDLALRGFELSRRRLDNNALEWDQYTPLRGHYNATASGVLDALNEKGLTPVAAQLWKTTHSRHWMELEEPAYMTQYCKDLFQKLIPHIQAPHSGLKALNNMLVLLCEKSSDPKSVAIIRSSIEANTLGLNKAGFGIEVRALRAIYEFDTATDYLWLEKYLPKLSSPVASPPILAPAIAQSNPLRKKGLQKCTPNSDFDSEPSVSPEPVGEPWEEVLGTLPGAVKPMNTTPTAPLDVPKRAKGLQKSSASNDLYDIGDNSFGM